MIPKRAIEKAIEGGWQADKGPRSKLNEFNRYYEQAVTLDPTFWQALGKALEWAENWTHLARPADHEWQMRAHHFYDLILTNGDTEKFWNELLKV